MTPPFRTWRVQKLMDVTSSFTDPDPAAARAELPTKEILSLDESASIPDTVPWNAAANDMQKGMW